MIGPAGAGKSALVRALRVLDPRVIGGSPLWGQEARSLVKGAVAVVPTIASTLVRGQFLHPAEVAQMARLEALGRALGGGPRGALRVMDEGPLFALAWLDVFFPRNGCGAAWRRRMLEHWAGRLAAVVCLDAPDPVLADRIRTRTKPHMVKHAPDTTMAAFAARFRRAFDDVRGGLMRTGTVPLLEYTTLGESATDLAMRVLPALRVQANAL